MERQFDNARYWTTYVEDRTDGFAGLELHRERDGTETVAARVIFWDAMGHYYIETIGEDLPLVVAEQLIAETKARINVK